MMDALRDWLAGLGAHYGVNPFLFAAIYVGAVPLFSLSLAWLARSVRRGKSPVIPALSASFWFVSAYLYLLAAGRNIPAWVYFFIAAMVIVGGYSAVRKMAARLREAGKSA
jgi:hypothetical protein